MKLNFTLGASAVAGLALLAAVASTPAEATHWRGGNISWTPSPTNANTITFEVTSYWRRSAFGACSAIAASRAIPASATFQRSP